MLVHAGHQISWGWINWILDGWLSPRSPSFFRDTLCMESMKHLAVSQINGLQNYGCNHFILWAWDRPLIHYLSSWQVLATASASHVEYVSRGVCHNQGTAREGRCTENHAHRDLYRKMFITTLFIIAKNWQSLNVQ